MVASYFLPLGLMKPPSWSASRAACSSIRVSSPLKLLIESFHLINVLKAVRAAVEGRISVSSVRRGRQMSDVQMYTSIPPGNDYEHVVYVLTKRGCY
jgi:hypothetical protein